MTQYRGTNDKKKRKQILNQMQKNAEDYAKDKTDIANRSIKASNQTVRSAIQGKVPFTVKDWMIDYYFKDPNKANELGARTGAKVRKYQQQKQINNSILAGYAQMHSSSTDVSPKDIRKAQKLSKENEKLDRLIANEKKKLSYAFYQASQMQDNKKDSKMTQAVDLRINSFNEKTLAEQERTQVARLRSQLERGSGSSGGRAHGGTGHTPKVNRTGTNTEVFNPGSITALNQEVRKLQKERDNIADPTKIAAVDAKIKSIKDNIAALNYSAQMIDFDKVFGDTSSLSNQLSKSGLDPTKSILGDQKINFDVNSADLKNVGDAISDWIEKMKEADPQFQSMKEEIESIGQAGKDAFSNFGGDMASYTDMFTNLGKVFVSDADAATKAGAGLSVVGQMMSQVAGNGDAAKVGAILAAVGQITLGFANASVQAAALGPFGWIAWLGAGLAALTTTISTVKGFNDGGIVNGSTTTGDNTLVRVNRGEMILNSRQQAHLFKMLDGGLALNTQSSGGSVNFKISGSNLYGTLKNYSNMQSKVGRNTGIRSLI